jgi:hypothetical protein
MKTLLARILCSAAYSMRQKDPNLGRYTSDTNQHELNLAFHYARELHRWFSWLDCDFDVSKIACDYERPDIIQHRRATHALNFLVIEVKRERSRKAVPLDLEQIRGRWFERYFYRYGAAIILADDKPEFEIQVLSRREKNEKPTILSHADMGHPLPVPDFTNGRFKEFSQSIERLTAMLHSGKEDVNALEREIDELVYALYGLTPEEKALVQAAAK